MAAEVFCKAHGKAYVAWLRDNTEVCKCDEKYGSDEKRRRGGVINADTEILCRSRRRLDRPDCPPRCARWGAR